MTFNYSLPSIVAFAMNMNYDMMEHGAVDVEVYAFLDSTLIACE
jgi:hypothetical protein